MHYADAEFVNEEDTEEVKLAEEMDRSPQSTDNF